MGEAENAASLAGVYPRPDIFEDSRLFLTAFMEASENRHKTKKKLT